MANFALVTCTDGNFLTRTEYEDRDSAVVGYDNLHAALVSDKEMKYGTIKILDRNLDCLEGKWCDTITHPEPEPEPEPES